MLRWRAMHMEHLKIGRLRIGIGSYGLTAVGIIAVGVFIRVLLLSQGWPHTTMDEGTLGEMAMNIAYHGEHPLFFYGQNYMGSLQAYLAAGVFHIFGASLFSLRIGLVFLFVLFLISMYLLASLLYTKKLALYSILLLSLGASNLIYRELQAIGGYPESLLFGSLTILFASWLALTSDLKVSPGRQRWRMVTYFGWGVAVGLGLWSDLLVVPMVVMSGLLLLLFCLRDMRTWALLYLLLGLAIGGLPLIIYNLHANHNNNTLATVIILYHGGAAHGSVHQLLTHSIISTLLISLPTISSYNPVCDVSSTLFFGGKGPGAIQCAVFQGAWSLIFIALWITAVFLAIRSIWKLVHQTPSSARTLDDKQDIIRSCTHLAVLPSAGISFLLFAISPTATLSPYLDARYLLCVLIAIPAVIYPLRNAATSGDREALGRFARIIKVDSKRFILVCIALMFLIGTVRTFGEIPSTQATNQQQEELVQQLLRIGAKHIYSDFWSCDRIVFQSYQQIACSVMTEQLQHFSDRYKPNGVIVQSDPGASYVFPIYSPQAHASALRFSNSHRPYRHFILDGYVVYQPE